MPRRRIVLDVLHVTLRLPAGAPTPVPGDPAWAAASAAFRRDLLRAARRAARRRLPCGPVSVSVAR